MIRRTTILLLLFVSTFAWADKQDLARFLPKECHHHGEFIQQKQLAALAEPLTSQGRFAFSCEAGLIWHSDSPLRETLVYPLKLAPWGLNAQGQRQTLDGPVHKQLGNLLNRLIGGDLSYLERHFLISQSSAEDQPESLTLVPKAGRMKRFIQNIRMLPGSDQVEILMTHTAEEYTRIQIHAQQSLTQLNAQSCTDALPDLASACQGLLP